MHLHLDEVTSEAVALEEQPYPNDAVLPQVLHFYTRKTYVLPKGLSCSTNIMKAIESRVTKEHMNCLCNNVLTIGIFDICLFDVYTLRV